jgi:hypothetical protein
VARESISDPAENQTSNSSLELLSMHNPEPNSAISYEKTYASTETPIVVHSLPNIVLQPKSLSQSGYAS